MKSENQMPISFAPGGAHYDVTPLENLFIENYMAEAQGEFVKVYIYGLMFCYRADEQPQDYADIARDLHLNEDSVRAAIAYWEKLQLVNVVSARPLVLEYVNLKQKFSCSTKSQELKSDTIFQELSKQVQSLFANERVISTAEYKRVFDWYEVYHFEQAAIAPLIAYCLSKKGMKVSFNYIDTVLMDLAQKEITSAEEVERWIMGQEAMNSGAARVLARWSLRRAPTVDEMLLYRKWTDEWGFTEDAVMAACREITATDKPNFKYLDAIMESFHEDGYLSAKDIISGIEDRKRRKEICSDITKSLGMRASVSNSTELMRLYEHFSNLGFTDTAMLMAARMLALEGRHTLADLAARLNKWHEDGTVSDESLVSRKEKAGEATQIVQYWLEIWGQSRAPSPGELAAYTRFTEEWGFSDDIANYAAERSAFADRPLAMMGKLLSDWREKSISDRRGAAEEMERAKPTGSSREDFSDRSFQNQNTYTKEQFDNMKTGIFDLKDL
jgi:DNA replication protein DnaD